MKTLLEINPNASQEAQRLNPHLCPTGANKTISSTNLARIRGRIGTLMEMKGDRVAIRRGRMNKTEAEFAMILEAQKRKGEIRDYLFHPFSLPWAGMRYTPDFMVTPNFGLEKRKMIEVKGPHIHYRQQAIARFKGARWHWPEFEFELWRKSKDFGWRREL